MSRHSRGLGIGEVGGGADAETAWSLTGGSGGWVVNVSRLWHGKRRPPPVPSPSGRCGLGRCAVTNLPDAKSTASAPRDSEHLGQEAPRPLVAGVGQDLS